MSAIQELDAQAQDRAAVRSLEEGSPFAPSYPNGILVEHPARAEVIPGSVDPSIPTNQGRLVNLVTTPLPVASTEGEQLIPDAGFETSVNGWTGNANTTVAQSSTQAHGGTYSMRYTSAGSAAVSAHSGHITMFGGWTYRASVWARAGSTVRTVTITVEFFDASDVSLGTASDGVLEVASTWQQTDTGPFLAPAGTSYGVITIATNTAAAAEIHYLDDVSLKAISGHDGDWTVFDPGNIRSENYESGVDGWAINGEGDAEFNNVTVRGHLLAAQATLQEGANLLPNGAFEVDSSGWTGTDCTLTRDTGTKRTGTGSLKLTRVSTPATMNVATPTGTSGVAAIPNAHYTFRAFVKTVTDSDVVNLYISWYDSAGTLISTSSEAGVGSTTTLAWKGFAYGAIAPALTAFASVKMEIASPGGNAFMDDAAFFQSSYITANSLSAGTAAKSIIYNLSGHAYNDMYVGYDGEAPAEIDHSFHGATDAAVYSRLAVLSGVPSSAKATNDQSRIYLKSRADDATTRSEALIVADSIAYGDAGSSTPDGYFLPLIGYDDYTPGSDTAVASTTSTSFVDVDATNCVVTFTAPASGIVEVEIDAFTYVAGNGAFNSYWGLRSGSSTVSGSGQLMANGLGHSLFLRYRKRFTGLTAGTSYTWKFAHRVDNAAVGSNIYGGPNYGTVSMRVWGVLS